MRHGKIIPLRVVVSNLIIVILGEHLVSYNLLLDVIIFLIVQNRDNCFFIIIFVLLPIKYCLAKTDVLLLGERDVVHAIKSRDIL